MTKTTTKRLRGAERNISSKYCEINPNITAYNMTLYTPGPRDSPYRIGSGSGTGPLDVESPGPYRTPRH